MPNFFMHFLGRKAQWSRRLIRSENIREKSTCKLGRLSRGSPPSAHAALSHQRRAARSHHAYLNRTVTPPTAADTSAPILGPLSCRITPLAFCN